MENFILNLNDPVTTRILILTFDKFKTFELQKVSCRFKRRIISIIERKLKTSSSGPAARASGEFRT